jgi:hypothetical protein
VLEVRLEEEMDRCDIATLRIIQAEEHEKAHASILVNGVSRSKGVGRLVRPANLQRHFALGTTKVRVVNSRGHDLSKSPQRIIEDSQSQDVEHRSK